MASKFPSLAEVAEMDLVELSECAEELRIEGCDLFKSDEEYREVIIRFIQSAHQARSYPAAHDVEEVCLPSAAAVAEMDLMELTVCAENHNIEGWEDFETADDFRDAIFKLMEKTQKPKARKKFQLTPFAATSGIFEDFMKKRDRVETLVLNTKKLVESESLGPWQEKLNLSKLSTWMKPADFTKASDSITKGKPVLLVAGSTSSGKSTLLNALLGASILPTSYNAATSVLCEISCSKDGSKYALLHMHGRKKKGPMRLDLGKQDGQDKFRKYVSPSRNQFFAGGKEKRCLKAEIFWPLDFLRNITLLDSPGVTEEEGEDAAARQIVHQCQNDVACGFIYVLNGTIAAEEGAQVGGLLKAIVKGTARVPPPDAAIFVINKWDILCTQQKPDEREKFLNLMRHEIASRWPGFKDRQLITMDSRLAAQMREQGVTTSDLQQLCNAISNVLPVGMDYMVIRSINPVQSLTIMIENHLEEALYALNLPNDERIKKWHNDWERFNTFRRSMESGRIAMIRNTIQVEIKSLVEKLSKYLRSDEAKRIILKWKKEELEETEQKMFDDKQTEELIRERFVKAITQSAYFLDFTRWASGYIMEEVQSVMKELKDLEVAVSNVTPTRDPGELLRKFGQELGEYGGMQKAAAVALTVAMVLVAPVVLALGTLQVTLLPLYKLADFISSMNERKFRRTLEQGYKELLDRSFENDFSLLTDTVKNIVINAVEPVKLTFRTIPERIDDLKQRLDSRANHEAADIPLFERALEQVRQVNGSLAKFELEMNIHEFRINDISWPNPRKTPQSRGSYGSVFDVSLPGNKRAVLKRLPEPITEGNAGDRLKKLLTLRKSKNAKNVVSFLGSVLTCRSPLTLDLLFEDNGDQSLADLIFGTNWELPSQFDGFMKAKDTAMQIVDGLEFLHENAIVHGHLSPDTILVTRQTCGVVKLTQPSTSLPVVNEVTLMTPYLAPEVLRNEMIRQSSDIYSIGVIFWEMLNGRRAYLDADLESMGINEFVSHLSTDKFYPGMSLSDKSDHSNIEMSPIAASWDALARKCWSSVERERPSLSEVKDCFNAMAEQSNRKRSQTADDVATVVGDKDEKRKSAPCSLTHAEQPSQMKTLAKSEVHSESKEAVELNAAEIEKEHEGIKSGYAVDQVSVIQSLPQQMADNKLQNCDSKSEVDDQKLIIGNLKMQISALTKSKQNVEAALFASEEKLKELNGMSHINQECLSVSEISIGCGSLGERRLAKWKGVSVAVKVLDTRSLSHQSLRHLADDLAVTSHIRHPNVASIFGIVMSDGLPSQIVMELLEGSVSDVIAGAALSTQYLTLREQVDFSTDITCGLVHLHELKPRAIVHGDLRPSNVLVSATMVAKISDTGFWRVLGSSLPSGISLAHVPPERLPSQSSVVPRATVNSDLYGLGVTLLEIFSGQPASKRERELQLSEITIDSVRQLCTELTGENPNSRPTTRNAQAVLEAIRGSFQYQQAPRKRLVKGKSQGGLAVTLVDSPCK